MHLILILAALPRSLSHYRGVTVLTADYRDLQFPILVQFSNVASRPWAELYGKRN